MIVVSVAPCRVAASFMSRLLLEKPFPGATTCVLVGDARSIDRSRLEPFRRLLWLTDSESVQRARPILPRSAVQTAIVGQAPATLIVEQFLRHDPRHLPAVFVSDGVLTRHADTYRRIIAEIQAVLESTHRTRITRQKDGFTWQKHVLENLLDYASRRLPSAWQGALAGRPAFIFADRLPKALPPVLAAHAPHAVMVATHASVASLAQHGIVPDFILSVHSTSKTPETLSPDWPSARLILSPVSPPSWRTAAPRSSRFYLSTHQATIEWLATQGIDRPPLSGQDDLLAAVDLARFLGCAPLYLIAPPRTSRWQDLDDRLAGCTAYVISRDARANSPFRHAAPVAASQLAFAPPAVPKLAHLARLAAADAPATAALHAARNRVRLAATLGRTKVSQLRSSPALHNPAATASALHQLFADRTFAGVFGSFAEKIQPHLAPPIEDDDALWRGFLDELDQLASLALE